MKFAAARKSIPFFVIVLIPLLITLFSAEIYLRLFSKYGRITPETMRDQSLEFVSSVFAKYVLSAKEKHVRGLNQVEFDINPKGYRGHDFSWAKPAGKIRIAFYGGSSVFDIAAAKDKDWPHRVESLLHQKGFPNVEVINAAVPGHAAFDALGSFFAEGHLFEPDYVVLYTSWNDIKFFALKEPLLRRLQPHVENQDPLLNYQGPLDQWLSEHSQLYVRLRYRFLMWRYRVGPEGQIPWGKRTTKMNEWGLKQFRLTVETFVDLVRNAGATPVLMTEARLCAPNNTEEEKKRIRYEYQLLTHNELLEAYEKADQILAQVAEAKKVPLIDASRWMTGKDEFFVDEVHLTKKGSETLAEMTAEAFIPWFNRREIRHDGRT